MTEKLQYGLITGRPFGGIGILFNKKLGLSVRVVDVMKNCRVAVLHCTFPTGYSIAVVVVYFPCLNSSAEYECELTECLGFIETCLDMVTCYDIIVLGDMNFECSGNNIGFKIFNDFCTDVGLKRADSSCHSMIDCTVFILGLSRGKIPPPPKKKNFFSEIPQKFQNELCQN